MCEFTEMYKKKFEASEELKSVEISVQKAMIIKNKELSELAVLQKIDILQRQIDTVAFVKISQNHPKSNPV